MLSRMSITLWASTSSCTVVETFGKDTMKIMGVRIWIVKLFCRF